MKGLLTKDLQIVLMQKKFLILLTGIACFMGMTTEDSTFLIGYISFMFTILALGTISYDDFDNGYTFLFTLPITKTGYVVEKYLFSLLISLASGVFSTVLSLLISLVKAGTVDIKFQVVTALMILAVCLIMLFIMIPLRMKFGADKSKIVMISIVGIFAIFGYILKAVISKLQHIIPINFTKIIAAVSSWNELSVILFTFLICAVIMGITMKISINIMKKKQL
ncbi:MAG: ABC-2 transporter permease [Lachnospiraceae bacterium]|nr:ABC-2 transporter permease [Lachnospiraceae bacterium]